MKYNSLYILMLSATIIFFNVCNAQEVSTKQSQEIQEKELLENILKHPSQDPKRDYSRCPVNYFEGLFDAVRIMKELNQDATPYIDLLNTEAISYINHVASDDEHWQTVENKLAEIKKHLPDETSFYLELALEHNQPKAIIPQKEESQPQSNIFAQAITYIWDGITNTFKSLLT